ncbi:MULTISPECIES: DegT/DnrJ/EryC1/StrS family aminotransferase [unclassified Micromonospora]|uniref:DegT/DnrJ/EryC1/StrS family aminotransferase n=1 Tax=unclassified Micromonospora TaxID=2617518 RepID=UPI0033E9027E
MINVFQPSVGAEELAAVGEAFDSNWLGYGPRTREFERAFGEHLGVPPETLLFLNSATSALGLTARLLEFGPGDEVVVPSVSFVANANTIAASGARVVFCDVDPHTLNPSVADIAACLTPRTKAVTILHYGGHPGEVVGIAELCRERGIPLVEDAACAVYSQVAGKACGTFADVGIWSFDSRKIITTGDGGMIYLRDPEMARRAHRLAYHGMQDRGAFAAMARDPRRWWDQTIHEVGQRLIGNDMTAAIGQVQLRRLPGFVARRRDICAAYDRALAGLRGVRLCPQPPEEHRSTHYFYWVQVDPALRDGIAEELLENGVYTTFRYPPLHRVPLYGSDARLPGTDAAAATTLLLPLHQSLTDAEVEQVASLFRTAVERRTPAVAV